MQSSVLNVGQTLLDKMENSVSTLLLEGEIDWVIEGREDQPVHAKAGDFVYVPAMTFHHIFPKGGKPSVRLGIALPGTGGHLHERPDRKVKVTVE